MRKLIFIMTMLVVAMGVSFTANAQTGEPLPYEMVYDDLDVDNWNITHTNSSYDPNTPSGEAKYVFTDPGIGSAENTLNFEKSFDFSNSEDIEITFGFSKVQGSTDILYRIEIGGVSYFNPPATNSNVSDNIQLGLQDINSFIDPSNVSIVISVKCTDPNGFFMGEINLFEITHTPNSVGINENYLNDNLEVYSFNKSIFISSNDRMNADVMVYNMSGQMVNSEKMNLSSSKNEMNLYDVPTGMYIVHVTDGTSVMRKKVFIE